MGYVKRRIVREIPEFRVKYKDIFHLKNLYIMMHEMLWEEGWNGYEGDRWHQDIETLYSENVFQRGIHLGGKEMWIWWRCRKDMEGKYSGYFRYLLDIDFHGVYLQDVEIIHQGKKIKVTKGELEIFFRPRIEGDYTGKWRSNKFLKHFQDIFEKRIMLSDIEKMEKNLWRTTYQMQNKVKEFLNLRTYVPTAPPFHPRLYGHEGEPE
jgi:hypothetical protein